MNGAGSRTGGGATLRALRLRSGLSQRELARRAAVPTRPISMIEADGSALSVGAASGASALGVGIADFFAAPEPQANRSSFAPRN